MEDFPNRFKRTQINKAVGTFTPIIVFDRGVFRQLINGDIDGLISDMSTMNKYMSEKTLYPWGNSHFRFSNDFGEEFCFQIYKSKKGYDLSVWEHTGGTLVFTSNILDNSNSVVNDALECANRFSKGEKRCSDCKEWMNYQENKSHRYFAGTYCTKCWESKWKAIEEEETYN